MELVINVPRMHQLQIKSAGYFEVWDEVDGIAYRVAGPQSDYTALVVDFDRELVLKWQDDDAEPATYLADKSGLEFPDPSPVEVPLMLKAQPSMRTQIIEELGRYLSARAMDEGYESLEEANDFDLDAEIDDMATEAEEAFRAAFRISEGGLAPVVPETTGGTLKPVETVLQEEEPVATPAPAG